MLVSRMMIFLILKVLKFDEVSFRAKKKRGLFAIQSCFIEKIIKLKWMNWKLEEINGLEEKIKLI